MPMLILPNAGFLHSDNVDACVTKSTLQRGNAPRLEQAVELGVVLSNLGGIERAHVGGCDSNPGCGSRG